MRLRDLEKLKELSKKHITIGIHGAEGEQKKLVRKTPYNKPGPKFAVSPTLTVAEVASYNELGQGVPKRSFIESTFKKNKDKISKKFKELLSTRPDQSFDLIGIYITNLIKEGIRKGIAPSNSVRTISRKGSSTPLIDSGQLRNAITYKVHND